MISDASRVRIQTISLATIAVIMLMFSIYWLRPVLVPLVLAVFVVSGISPILGMLELRLGVNRLVAAAITFFAGLLILIVFGVAIWGSVAQLARNAGDYRDRIQEIVASVETRTLPWLTTKVWNTPNDDTNEVGDGEVDSSNQVVDEPMDNAAGAGVLPPTAVLPESGPDPSPQPHSLANADQFVDRLVRQGISEISGAMISLVSTSMVVLIYVFFILLGTQSTASASETIREMDLQVKSYLSLKTVISVLTGIAFGGVLWLCGVPMALTFGVLAFLLNFIPNIGPIIASLLPVPLIILDPEGSVAWMVLVIALTSGIQLISGNLVEPKLMGTSSDLHPVSILVALMFWGMMWGVIGMFLAVPITAVIKILLQRYESCQPIADMLAGRWTLPDESTPEQAPVA